MAFWRWFPILLCIGCTETRLGQGGSVPPVGQVAPVVATLQVDQVLGSGVRRAVVRGGKIEAAHIMSVTLSCDHRSIDGALGAELIGAFRRLVENPVMMMV